MAIVKKLADQEYVASTVIEKVADNIDTTLTQSGMAADAKVVGDALSEKQPVGNYALKSEIPTDYLKSIPDEYITETELTAKGYITEHQSLDGLATETYVDNKIAAIPTPDVSGQINTHNVATDAHNDIRLLVEGLTTRLNTLANSDDTTLDQMSEIVAYIKNNKSLIDGITTNKVSVAEIIDNLTTNVANKPLSAAQGVALKALIDAIVVPTKVSELTNDKGYLTSYTEADPTVPAWAKASNKPSYTKSEVGLGNVDNIKQYSAENPPVVTQPEAPTDTSVIWVDTSDDSDDGFQEAVNVALAQAKATGQFDGKTPEKGVDYFTNADKAEMVNAVIAALPVYAGEVL